MRLELRRHPDSRCQAVDRIEVTIARPSTDRLMLSYELKGQLGEIRIPALARAERTDELWRHTCFEAFIQASSRKDYYEFNFAPSRQWAAYHLKSYRSAMQPVREIKSIAIDSAFGAEHGTLQATVDLEGLSSLPRDADWRIGLSAVIETLSGDKSYWALSHPPGIPDFHHSDGFVERLLPALTT